MNVCKGLIVILGCVGISDVGCAAGNLVNESFAQTKKLLESRVYFDHRVTLYCAARFDRYKYVEKPAGFTTPAHQKRAQRIEWEHVVPAENFGRTFPEWRNGNAACVNSKGRFKGRRCAELTSREYRLMQSDMYNLYPAIGAVNALRSNYDFTVFSKSTPNTFGSCTMKIYQPLAEPPERSRGVIARTYKYMAQTYPRFRLSEATQKLMDAWDKTYPVDAWECLRAKRIQALQGNENPVLKEACRNRGF